MASLDQAIEQMYAAGMPSLPDGIARIDGVLHRYGPKGYGRNGRAFYKLYDTPLRNGKRVVTGFFGRWGEIDITKIRADFSGVEPDELRRIQQAQALQDRREREKRAARAKFAGNRAREQFHAARAHLNEGEKNAYLERKRLAWEKGLRQFADGTLAVPVIRYDVTEEQEKDPEYAGPLRLVSLQKISPEGAKRFNKGALVAGGACRFGPKPKDGELMLIGEGVATVVTALQALERAYTSWCAFDAGNLAPAARIVRKLYPNSPLLFLADDDAYLEGQLNARLRGDYRIEEALYKCADAEKTFRGRDGDVIVQASVYDDARGTPVMTAGIRLIAGGHERLRTYTLHNTGRRKAWEAAGELGNAWVAWPKFVSRTLSADPDCAHRLTDWNDLHVREGAERVIEQLGAEIRSIEELRALAKAMATDAPAAAAGADGGGGRGGAGKRSSSDAEPDWELHGSLLRRFALIYPSDTAHDAQKSRLVKVEHMRLAFGRDSVARWLGSPRRRTVDLERVVFDPLGKADRETTINLFRGIELKPSASKSCDRLLKLLQYLCGEADSDQAPVTDWVLKWCAYPLQHLGAKMQTAIVMHGEEGTGKNLFWGALRSIYGRYGAMITQRQLEDKFNSWQSAKLFVIANEVVTRAEMSHHVGLLKSLITEDTVYINPKMVDQREETNHMQLVFCSNELQALKIGPRDRRYMVIRTPRARDAEFYKAVGAEVADGGAQALYRYLLDLELGDFGPHTKPIMTEAKQEMIEVGLPSAQLFWHDLHGGLLGLPYGPCLAQDLYRVYTVWCVRSGHKMPQAMNYFSSNFKALNGVRRVDRRVPDPGKPGELVAVGTADEARLRMRRVFLMGEPKADPLDESQRIVQGIGEFRKAMSDYLADDFSHGGTGSANRAREDDATSRHAPAF